MADPDDHVTDEYDPTQSSHPDNRVTGGSGSTRLADADDRIANGYGSTRSARPDDRMADGYGSTRSAGLDDRADEYDTTQSTDPDESVAGSTRLVGRDDRVAGGRASILSRVCLWIAALRRMLVNIVESARTYHEIFLLRRLLRVRVGRIGYPVPGAG
ncbi:hypothetical protein Acor_48170 [Acrocarpospora corrugata]|uniref:Uncharacterized protein n=1 Tax=Acrocarpospora corrugata TaxID=35763 RepID=A0A5M3W6E5_9ACTN|nr:hypothetical protein Acor_48170 [Acrocarpospora corrugata]